MIIMMKQPDLGNKVIELRHNLRLTQAELAERCGLSLRTIQRIEALEITPRSYTVKTIFKCLGYDWEKEQIGTSDNIIKANRFKRIFKRAIEYVRELFNLKTNTMKKLSILSLFTIFLFAGILFASGSLSAQSRRATEKSLVGIWQQVKVNPETDEVIRYLPYLKIINSDGTYYHISECYGKEAYSFINAVGKWKVKSEDTFLEYVELMHDDNIRNRTEVQTFKIVQRENMIFMYNKFYTIGSSSGRETYEV